MAIHEEVAMRFNTLKPAEGSKKAPKRVGRGGGSGLGKTCGRGHKGQHARAGGYNKVGFEGGQMPLQRRLPKFGFTSLNAKYVAEIRLYELSKLDETQLNIEALKKANLISSHIRQVKIIFSGKIDRAFFLSGIKVTANAKAAIEAAGGKVEE
jgi:large subunit ribosomal protein L15